MNPASFITAKPAFHPILPFCLRLAALFMFLCAAVWAERLPTLLIAGAAAIIYRFSCGFIFKGLIREILYTFIFASIAGLFASGSRPSESIPTFIAELFLRLFLAFTPSMAFARSLETREMACNLSPFMPASLLLGLEISLRFVPVLLREFYEVIAIQRARKAIDIAKPATCLRAIFFPFFLRMFKISERVAYGLKTRRIHPDQSPKRVPYSEVDKIVREFSQEKTRCQILSKELSAQSIRTD